jgi:hypothetical protein
MTDAFCPATGCESAGVVTEYRFSETETRSMDRSAFKMGSYGAGALWCLKEREGKYITFNNVRIARQGKDGTWMGVERAGRLRKPAQSMSGFSTTARRE